MGYWGVLRGVGGTGVLGIVGVYWEGLGYWGCNGVLRCIGGIGRDWGTGGVLRGVEGLGGDWEGLLYWGYCSILALLGVIWDIGGYWDPGASEGY